MRSWRPLLVSLVLVAAVCLGAVPAHAEKRVALVIGNSEYKVGPLANPANDADAVAAAFEALGFDRVLLRKNLGVEGFRTALSEMARESAGADVAAVFFAGHGTERDGRNYLIPVDAKLDRASDLDLQAIGLSIVLDQIAGASKLKLVILDACRNNVFPLAGARRSVTRGLARIEPEDNTLVVYAAKEGTLADDGAGTRHSPFTAALLKHIATPGLEISFVFRRVRDDVARATSNRQQPHLYGTLGGDAIYLKAAAAVLGTETEDARKAIAAEKARLAEERRLIEEERKKLALAAPPVSMPRPAQETEKGAADERPFAGRWRASFRCTLTKQQTSYQGASTMLLEQPSATSVTGKGIDDNGMVWPYVGGIVSGNTISLKYKTKYPGNVYSYEKLRLVGPGKMSGVGYDKYNSCTITAIKQ